MNIPTIHVLPRHRRIWGELELWWALTHFSAMNTFMVAATERVVLDTVIDVLSDVEGIDKHSIMERIERKLNNGQES